MGTFEIVGIIALVIWSITTHEVAHGWVAYKCGDPTAKQLGRITLNPLPHVDPFMTILLPVFLVMTLGLALGGARPVPVVPGRMRHPRRDMAIVAAAGPISNILIATVFAALLAALVHGGVWATDVTGVTVLGMAIWINLGLAAFNLFPLPPLDGSRVVAFFLRGEAEQFWYQLERVGLFLLVGILFFIPDLLWSFVWPIVLGLAQALDYIFDIEEPLMYAWSQVAGARS